jgi:hypothetical protein
VIIAGRAGARRATGFFGFAATGRPASVSRINSCTPIESARLQRVGVLARTLKCGHSSIYQRTCSYYRKSTSSSNSRWPTCQRSPSNSNGRHRCCKLVSFSRSIALRRVTTLLPARMQYASSKRTADYTQMQRRKTTNPRGAAQ